jgi:hypothetical protein
MDAQNKAYALHNQYLANMFDQLRSRIAWMTLSAPGLVIGSTSKKEVKIANTTVYLADGLFKSKSSAEVAFTATTDDIAPNASSVQEACYLVCLAADGTASLVKGTTATGSGTALLPEFPASKCVIGYVRIAVAAGATLFNATTDDLDSAHLTVAYTDLGLLAEKFSAAQ